MEGIVVDRKKDRGNEKNFVIEKVSIGGYKGIFRVYENGRIELRRTTYFEQKCNDVPLVTLEAMEKAIIGRVVKRGGSTVASRDI